MLNAITGRDTYFYDYLKQEIQKAKKIKIIVSFLRESGVKLIVDDLKKQALKGSEIKIITGKYLNITEPSALYLLKDKLGDMVDLRFFNNNNISFHPKAYFFKSEEEEVLFIGSSNISNSALMSGVEWNYRLIDQNDHKAYMKFEEEFDIIFNKKSIEINDKELRKYAKSWNKPSIVRNNVIEEEEDDLDKPHPRGAQIEALYELKLAREEGISAGMVVAATGVGKTYLAAFDSINFNKVLFIAHREEILKQAKDSYKRVDPNLKTSFFNGDKKDKEGGVVFASVHTLRKSDYLNEDYFKRDEFDYIIVDEFHHAAADSYKKILNYFEPEFLLGLTATPYRMDNKDIYELCNDNVIYEINLKDAINRDLLIPFKYYGIYDDEVDYDKVKALKGKYNIKDLEKKLSTHKRADLILKNYNNLAGDRTLAFCASIEHAKFMADYFNRHKIRAVCVHSSNNTGKHYMDRDEAINKIGNGGIDIIFAVDIFNEGVDIPALNTVLFLRPTESYVVFLQQLGRGLRKYQDKEYLRVLDFIGNYKRAHYLPFLLSGKNPMNNKRKDIRDIDEFEYPQDCQVSLDFKVIDLFKQMRANDPLRKRMEDEYFRLKRYLKRRPLRKDIYDGVDIKTREYLKRKYKSQRGYLRFLASIDELNEVEESWFGTIVEDFLIELENTSMSKSYKIPTLLSLLVNDKLESKVSIERVGITFMNYYKKYKLHQKDLNNKRHKDWRSWDKERFIKEVVRNPAKYLSKRKYFIHDEVNKVFMLNEKLEPYLGEELTKHFTDILKYRESRYFERRFKEEV